MGKAIQNSQESSELPSKEAKLKAYRKKYYQEHTDVYKAKYNANRPSRIKAFVGWVEVKKTLTSLKKEIGETSYYRILDSLDHIEKVQLNKKQIKECLER